jgi:hypothetical protein
MMLRHRGNPEAEQLTAECEAFLGGSYAEHLRRAGVPLPAWVWLNLIAHGTLDELRALATGPAPPPVWPRARWFLAGEVLAAVESGGCSLRGLQRDALIPLEQQAMTGDAASRWGPAELVRRTRELVQGHARPLRR